MSKQDDHTKFHQQYPGDCTINCYWWFDDEVEGEDEIEQENPIYRKHDVPDENPDEGLFDELMMSQRILDRCEGNLAEAVTYAAFRANIARVLRAHWPTGMANMDRR